MDRQKEISVPRWFLEHVEDTLRIQNNINIDKETGETCQDRNVRQALNGTRKLLTGEELTGMERLERLKPYQAEKDLALTWEDVKKIEDLCMEVATLFASVGRNKVILEPPFYEEVLRRFNSQREKK